MVRLLVGFDGSEPSRRALAYAARRAALSGDEVVILTVLPAAVAGRSLSGMMPAGLALPPPLDQTFEASARARLEEAVAELTRAGVKARAELRGGEAAQAIVDAARELEASEVVIGHKSYEAKELRLGPVAESLVRNLPATVTVVR